MAKSRDLFEESSMSFGEHLEILRVHLIRALFGVVIACCFTLYYGQDLVKFISAPIKEALAEHYGWEMDDFEIAETQTGDVDPADADGDLTTEDTDPADKANEVELDPDVTEESQLENTRIKVKVSASDLSRWLHEADPDQFPEKEVQSEKDVVITLESELFRPLHESEKQQKALAQSIKNQIQPVTREVHEAFLVYLKVSIVSGLVASDIPA